MIRIIKFTFIFIGLYALSTEASERKYNYTYVDTEHTFSYTAKQVGILYGFNIVGYYLTQPDVVSKEGSFTKWKDNFGDVHFDKDASFWNNMVHPFSGSMVYLYYRAHGYTRLDSLFMTMLQSTLFEFTIETYTEAPSIQDLYQTPVLGSLLGFGLEVASMKLLNSNNQVARFFGHVINPFVMFDFYKGKMHISPLIQEKKISGLSWSLEI